MIALLVALALAFAWACIATAIAVANDKAAKVWKDAADRWQETANAWRDRIDAGTLSEYHASRRVAMHVPEPREQKVYGFDPTGLVVSELEPLDDRGE